MEICNVPVGETNSFVDSQSLFLGLPAIVVALFNDNHVLFIEESWLAGTPGALRAAQRQSVSYPQNPYLHIMWIDKALLLCPLPARELFSFTDLEFPRGTHPMTTELFPLAPYHLHNGNVSLGGVLCSMALIVRSSESAGLGIPFHHLHRMYFRPSTAFHIYRPLTAK